MLVVFAMNGNVSAHEVVPHQQGISVHASAGSAIDQDVDLGGHESSSEHTCGYHGGGGCGAQWAFPPVENILPIPRSIAWVSLGRTVHQRGALIPLGHPPKASFFH